MPEILLVSVRRNNKEALGAFSEYPQPGTTSIANYPRQRD